MSNLTWILIGAAAVVVALWRLLAPNINRAVARARSEGDVSALLEQLLALKPTAQPDAFNQAIRQLWDDYERELCTPLIKALAEQHDRTQIAQYWLDQLQGVEPELAQRTVGQEFIRAHYDPHLAATCGKAG